MKQPDPELMRLALQLEAAGAFLHGLRERAEELLVEPQLEGNEGAKNYLRSIARRAGDLNRSVGACCYQIAYVEKKNAD